jgi:hypothetical protein
VFSQLATDIKKTFDESELTTVWERREYFNYQHYIQPYLSFVKDG